MRISKDIARAQRELQLLACPEIGMLRSEAPAGSDQNHFVSHIMRSAVLISAWTRKLVAPMMAQQRQPPKGSCLAVRSINADTSFSCELMKGLDLVRPMQVKPGSHAFVKCLDEPFLRVALMAGKVHRSMMLH